MAQFIRDVRNDLEAPEMPFVIGVMEVGGPVAGYGPDRKRHVATHSNFRDAMEAPSRLPEFAGNVVAVRTEKCWDQELSDVVARDAEIKQQLKRLKSDGKLSRKNEQATLDELWSRSLPTVREKFSKRAFPTLNITISDRRRLWPASEKRSRMPWRNSENKTLLETPMA